MSALINLVRQQFADDTAPDHDYTSGEIFSRHEEIELVDPEGCPNAIPSPAAYQNIDYAYQFITGARGHQARAILRDITLNIDYMDNEQIRRLEHWMQQRARFWISPNMGRNTEFSFRPVEITGTDFTSGGTAVDLTENHEIEFNGVEFSLVWDYVKRRFVKKPSADLLPFHHTEGGAGLAFARSARNFMVPPSPEGATASPGAGNSGWSKAGTDASQLTFTYDATAFGHPDCPGVLRVAYTDDVSTSRSIRVSSVFDPGSGDYGGLPLTILGTMPVCIWIRGQLPDDASLALAGTSGFTTVDLSGARFDGWTPLIISRYEADWTTSVPVIDINLSSSDGMAGAFEIGPTMITQSSSAFYSPGAYWNDSQGFPSVSKLTTANAFAFPDQGTAIVSFTVPDWWGADYQSATIVGLFGNTDFGAELNQGVDGLDRVVIREFGVASGIFNVVGSGTAVVPGKINTFAYVWSGAGQKVFLNGVLVGTVDRTTDDITFGGNDTVLRVGYNDDNYHMYPCVLLSLRIDEGAMTDTEVKNIHYALTDPIALQLAVQTRGRLYEITSIPQTVRHGAGGSQVLGQLKLRQVNNYNWLNDPLNKEESIP